MVDSVNGHMVLKPSTNRSICRFVDVQIFDPSAILGHFNHGPFVLMHGFLDRAAVLFEENYDITGVINWEFTQTEPL